METETGTLTQGQTRWATCSQLVTNKSFSSPAKDREQILKNLLDERMQKEMGRGKEKGNFFFIP